MVGKIHLCRRSIALSVVLILTDSFAADHQNVFDLLNVANVMFEIHITHCNYFQFFYSAVAALCTMHAFPGFPF